MDETPNDIPSVPSTLQKPNDEAYSPKLITVGPIHRGSKSHLLAMEEHKWFYMLSLLHQTQNLVSALDKSGSVTLHLDEQAMVVISYMTPMNLQRYAFGWLFLVRAPSSIVATNLTLLENQIPFFVIKTLTRILFPSLFTRDVDHLVSDLALSLFRYPLIRCPSVAHFVHLLYLSSIIDEGQKVRQAHQELRQFSKGVLEIPPLHIVNTTEVYLRNFITWEQRRIAINRHFTSYALFFKGLICSLQDSELLIEMELYIKSSLPSRLLTVDTKKEISIRREGCFASDPERDGDS
ncbi:hypothetical protein K1719_034276 [Acacia pycnantha]|nr:hypothetical protein K1719_034276 [Acacia pycnantha]